MKKYFSLLLLGMSASLHVSPAQKVDKRLSYHKYFASAWVGSGLACGGYKIFLHYSDFIKEHPEVTFKEYLTHLAQHMSEHARPFIKNTMLFGAAVASIHGIIHYCFKPNEVVSQNSRVPGQQNFLVPRTQDKPSVALDHLTKNLRAACVQIEKDANRAFIAMYQDELADLRTQEAQLQAMGAPVLLVEVQATINRKQALLTDYKLRTRVLEQNPPHFHVGHVRGLLQQSGVDCGFYAAWFTNQFEKIDINNPASVSAFIAGVSGPAAREAYNMFFKEKTAQLDKEFRERLENPPAEADHVDYFAALVWEGPSARRFIHDFEVLSLTGKASFQDLPRTLSANLCARVCRPQNIGADLIGVKEAEASGLSQADILKLNQMKARQRHHVALGVIQVPTGVNHESLRVYIPLNSIEGGKYVSNHMLNKEIIEVERSVFKGECPQLDGAAPRQRPQTVAQALKTYDKTMAPAHKAFLQEVVKYLDV